MDRHTTSEAGRLTGTRMVAETLRESKAARCQCRPAEHSATITDAHAKRWIRIADAWPCGVTLTLMKASPAGVPGSVQAWIGQTESRLGEVANREQFTTERTETGDHLHHPAAGTQVADVPFGRGDRRLILGIAEDFGDRLGFLLVALVRSQSVGVNVPDRFGIDISQRSAQARCIVDRFRKSRTAPGPTALLP